jgi:hypothetical protein
LKRHAMLLSLGKNPTSTRPFDVGIYQKMNLYKFYFFYIDNDGDKVMIASDSHLQFAILQCNISVKIFASFTERKTEEEESQTLESAAESSIQADHSATSIANPSPFIIKLALVDSGGK